MNDRSSTIKWLTSTLVLFMVRCKSSHTAVALRTNSRNRLFRLYRVINPSKTNQDCMRRNLPCTRKMATQNGVFTLFLTVLVQINR